MLKKCKKKILTSYNNFFKKLEDKFIFRLIDRFSQDNANMFAAGIAYYALLSFFPIVLVAFAVFGILLKREDIFLSIIDYIGETIPMAQNVIKNNLSIMIRASKLNTIIGILGLMWISNRIVCSIENALHFIWREENTRQYLIHKLRATLLVLPWITLIYFTFLITSFLQTVASIPFKLFSFEISDWPFLIDLLKFFISIIVTAFFFFLAYKTIPKKKFTNIALFQGAILFATLFELSKLMFFYFLKTIVKNYSIYGSLAATIIMILWIYIGAIFFLMGAEFIYLNNEKK